MNKKIITGLVVASVVGTGATTILDKKTNKFEELTNKKQLTMQEFQEYKKLINEKIDNCDKIKIENKNGNFKKNLNNLKCN